jgi:hypothetical protein
MIWFENLSLPQQAGLLFVSLLSPMLGIHWLFSTSDRARTWTWTTGTQASLLSALAMHHAQSPQSRFLTMLVFTLTVLAYFLTIVAFDHPFGGDVTVSQEPLRNVWGKAGGMD